MAKLPTKADLERQIANMRAAPSAEDRLVGNLADLIGGPDARRIKHAFFRRGDDSLQISIDMHEEGM